MDSRIKSKRQLYLYKWDGIGSKLSKLLIVLFVFTITIQLLFLIGIESIPPNVTLDMEGIAILGNPFNEVQGEIILKLDRKDKTPIVKVYINGENTSFFDNQYISLKVKNNDIIEISGIDCKDSENFSIYYVSDNIANPKAGLKFIVNNNIVLIGRVKMKMR